MKLATSMSALWPLTKPSRFVGINKLQLGVFLLLATGLLQPQSRLQGQNLPAQAPEFTSSSELVLVPVIIRDKKGNPVTGLTRDQFVLKDEGKPQEIGIFEEVTTTTERPQVNRELDHFANYLPGNRSELRLNIILIDLVEIRTEDYERVMRSVLQYLARRLDDDQPTALLLLSRYGLVQLHSFTTDTRLLIEAVQRTANALGSKGWFKEYGTFVRSLNTEDSASVRPLVSENIRRIDKALPRAGFAPPPWWKKYQVFDVLRGMEQVSYAYAGLPGRKSLVWITANVPFEIPDGDQWKTLGNDMVHYYQNIWRILNSANIAVYPLDVNGLVAASSLGDDSDQLQIVNKFREIAPTARQVGTLDTQRNYRDTYTAFAEATGGKPCINSNDIAKCLDMATRDSDAYYMLGFYLKPQDRKKIWHRLHVDVSASHGELRYRAGYFLDSKEPGKRDAARGEIGVAYYSPVDYTALPVDVTIDHVETVNKRRKLDFTVGLPPGSFYIDVARNNYVQVNLLAVALSDKQKVVAAFNKTIRGSLRTETASELAKTGFNHSDSLELSPGKYTLKFVVRDDLTRKMGSVTAPLEIR